MMFIGMERGHPVRQRAQHAPPSALARPVRASRSGGQDVRAPPNLADELL